MRPLIFAALAFILFAGAGVPSRAQVTAERLANAASEPANWLSYSGGLSGQRYSSLDQITPANISALKLKWVYQAAAQGGWQTSPLVVDGIMYITQRPNDVAALDAKTGRVFWIYHHKLDPIQIVCCGANNRGLALLEAPGNDAVSSTALTAAGATVILFTTGRGTPLGFPAPTLKIATNTALAQRKPGWIDFDAGRVLNEEREAVSEELLDLVIETASGQATRAEINGEREIAIWKTGVTL